MAGNLQEPNPVPPSEIAENYRFWGIDGMPTYIFGLFIGLFLMCS
ncbi:MAG: hypothetical protein ACXIU2_16745 [Cyclobacteriaceae bacterium]